MALLIYPKGWYVSLSPLSDDKHTKSSIDMTLDEWVEYKINEALKKRGI